MYFPLATELRNPLEILFGMILHRFGVNSHSEAFSESFSERILTLTTEANGCKQPSLSGPTPGYFFLVPSFTPVTFHRVGPFLALVSGPPQPKRVTPAPPFRGGENTKHERGRRDQRADISEDEQESPAAFL